MKRQNLFLIAIIEIVAVVMIVSSIFYLYHVSRENADMISKVQKDIKTVSTSVHKIDSISKSLIVITQKNDSFISNVHKNVTSLARNKSIQVIEYKKEKDSTTELINNYTKEINKLSTGLHKIIIQ